MTISFPVVQFATTAAPGSGQTCGCRSGCRSCRFPRWPACTSRCRPRRASSRCLAVQGRSSQSTVKAADKSLRQGGGAHLVPARPGQALRGGLGGSACTGGRNWLAAARPGPFTITDLSLVSGRVGGGRPARLARPRRPAPPGRSGAQLAAGVPAGPGRARRGLVPRTAPEREPRLDRDPRRAATDTRAARRLAAGLPGPGWSRWRRNADFGPVKFYHVGIVLSAAGVLGLLLVATVRRRRRRVPGQMDRALPASPSWLAAADRDDGSRPVRWRGGPASVGLGCLHPGARYTRQHG